MSFSFGKWAFKWGIAAAFFAGAALTYLLLSGSDTPVDHSVEVSAEPVRDIVITETVSEAVAEQHRANAYAELDSVEQIYTLPTYFARTAALYAFTDRSSPAEIQAAIFEANRMADDVERLEALTALFYGLAEKDPQSALALSRTPGFAHTRAFEYVIWQTWGRNNLDDALFAAKTQTSHAHQNAAAQGLYAAFGHMGNETTDRIQSELGIGPDRSNRAAYIYRLADKSPTAAVQYINGLEFGHERANAVSWLAYYLSLKDVDAAAGYEDQFIDSSVARTFRTSVAQNAARANPRASIERIIAENSYGRNRSEFHIAIGILAEQDLDAAIAYFEGAQSERMKRNISSAIATMMVRRDPLEALAWARAHETQDYPSLEMNVLNTIARNDPQFAIAEAMKHPSNRGRQQLVTNVISWLANDNPQDAVALLDSIDDQQLRDSAESQFVSNWIQNDADAALDWILSRDDESAAKLLASSSWALPRTDIDLAIRVLPKLDPGNQVTMRQQIATRLATSRSAADAQAFVQQFEGQPGYEQLQSALISGVANTDFAMAKQLADQLSDRSARDQAYSALVRQAARDNPQSAIGLVSAIQNEDMRNAATANLVSRWANSDRVAAQQFVSAMQPGASRDGAILQLTGNMHGADDELYRLVATMQDKEKRGQAKLQYIYQVFNGDPARMRQLMSDPDISDEHRAQLETYLASQR